MFKPSQPFCTRCASLCPRYCAHAAYHCAHAVYHCVPRQVTIGGLEHALTPLAAANPLIHVFDRPTLYKDALWLPYRRAHADIADAVQVAVKAAGGPRRPASLTAVFAHADVVGASLNSHYQARCDVALTLL